MIDDRSEYRADIDGLRAVAVLAVIAFHAESPHFRNGFAGVDVFFVISGYLISGVIFNALEKGTFSFREFYVRRINRILPALIVIVAATVVIGWVFMYSYEYATLGNHVLAASTFVSNFLLSRQVGYFDRPLRPLLHLWSLAVEEQFYLLWPIIAVLAWKRSRNVLMSILVLLIGASFVTGVVEIGTGDSVAAFYLPFGRFWEILSGGLLQFLSRGSMRRPPEPAENARNWTHESMAIAAALLGIAFFRLRLPGGNWPGWPALIPVAGTLLLISSPRSFINRRILSFGPLVTIGLISYPLYLWHWPLIVFSKIILNGRMSRQVAALVIAISFLLSAITYRFIEVPVRFGSHKRRSATLLFMSLPVMALLGYLMGADAIGSRLNGWPFKRRGWGPDWVANTGVMVNHGSGVLMFSQPGDSSRTVFMFGDSHMNQYWPRVLELAATRHSAFPTVSILAYGGCVPLPLVRRHEVWSGGEERDCERIYNAGLAFAHRPLVKTVVISAWWDQYTKTIEYLATDTASNAVPLGLADPRFDSVFDQFERDLASLTREGKRVFVILPSPAPGNQIPLSRVPSWLVEMGQHNKPQVLSRDAFENETGWISGRLREVSAKSGATLIDPADFLCARDVCPTSMASGIPIYWDDNHLRAAFVAKHATYLDQVFN
jgi:peptidoglycan/LPS O-acetylase OafA/YrhL